METAVLIKQVNRENALLYAPVVCSRFLIHPNLPDVVRLTVRLSSLTFCVVLSLNQIFPEVLQLSSEINNWIKSCESKRNSSNNNGGFYTPNYIKIIYC